MSVRLPPQEKEFNNNDGTPAAPVRQGLGVQFPLDLPPDPRAPTIDVGRQARRERAEAERAREENAGCLACGLGAPAFRCSRCKEARYCGEACQRRHYAAHRSRCKSAKK